MVRRRAPSQYVDPSHDNFKQRFATMRQISLSYGGDSCSTKDLSLELPHQKEKKGKQRLLTALEKEILSREGASGEGVSCRHRVRALRNGGPGNSNRRDR